MERDRLQVFRAGGPSAAAGCAILAWLLLAAFAVAAHAHGSGEDQFRTRILSVKPEGVPVEVRMVGDRIRFENTGSEELVLCGYETDRCEAWVRIGARGVRVDRNSVAWYANSDGPRAGDVPDGAGVGAPRYVPVRGEPRAYAYHDHRVHWMGGERLPPGVDEGDPRPQRVYDGVVEFRYGGEPGSVRTRLEYIGGRSWLQRHGETALTAAGVGAMVAYFLLDWWRRRRARRGSPASDAG